MKQKLLFLLLLLSAMTASADEYLKGLNIARFFNTGQTSERCSETFVSGQALDETGFTQLRTITYKNDPEIAAQISAAVEEDAANAVSKEVKYVDGKLYYAYYVLKPLTGGLFNRYLLFADNLLKGGDTTTLIFLCGPAGPERVEQLLNTK